MKTRTILIIVTLMCSMDRLNAQQPNSMLLHSGDRRSGANYEWWVPIERMKRLPDWKPNIADGGDPPLSVGAAVKIARLWVIKNGAPKDTRLQRVFLKPIDWEGTLFPNEYYYIITFEAGLLDSIDCVVLVDGSVVEPKRVAEKKEVHEKDERRPQPGK